METTRFPFLVFAILALPGAFLTLSSPPPAAGGSSRMAAVSATMAELAAVRGLQDGTEIVFEEGKCCGVGSKCTPETPVVEGGVACTKAASGGCIAAHEDQPCYAWSAAPVNNGACVAPPAGFVGPAQCAMDPRDFPCRKYRTGVCDSTGIFGYGDCVCDTNSVEVWAPGQKRCAQGSTLCVPVALPI